MDSFLYFSFLQGMLAFSAPCSVALLPAYIISFITRNAEQSSKARQISRGLKLAGLSILGILVIYLIAGIVVVVASNIIREYMKWVAISLGGVVIVLGLLMLLGKDVSLSFHLQQKTYKSEYAEAFFFGVAYAIGALGCLFPLFIVVATQAMGVPSVQGASYFLAYFLGISILMLTTIFLAIIAQNALLRYLRKIIPYVTRISGALLIFAGIYIIRYQMALF